jgi:hypothetical protein
MTGMNVARRLSAWLVGAVLLGATLGGASAQSLAPGEYACAGSGGRILIGLGFILRGDGTYTDLDGKSAGRITFTGSGAQFVGGHLDGQVVRNIRGGRNFEIGNISCSHN